MMALLGVAQTRLGDLRGEKGQRGERGATGRAGKAGRDAPRLVGLGLDGTATALMLRMSDGSKVPILLGEFLAGIALDQKNYAIVVKLARGGEMRLDVRPLFEQYDREKRGEVSNLFKDELA